VINVEPASRCKKTQTSAAGCPLLRPPQEDNSQVRPALSSRESLSATLGALPVRSCPQASTPCENGPRMTSKLRCSGRALAPHLSERLANQCAESTPMQMCRATWKPCALVAHQHSGIWIAAQCLTSKASAVASSGTVTQDGV